MISSGLLLTCQTSRYKLLILLENSNNINECIQISILYKQIDIELIYEYISNIMSQFVFSCCGDEMWHPCTEIASLEMGAKSYK